MTRSDLRTELLEGTSTLGVWGTGYIGFTSAVAFAERGVKVIGCDISREAVKAVNSGRVNIPNLEYWLGFDPSELTSQGLIKATTNWKRMLEKDVRVHLIAVPTERGGEPWSGPLKDVISKLAKRRPPKGRPDLIVIESTLTPGETDRIVIPILKEGGRKPGRDCLVVVAPRRDWFHSPEKSLQNLPRAIAGINKRSRDEGLAVLGIVCRNLMPASTHYVAELVKSVENSLLHVPSVYAMQLARAYPHVDIAEVLRMAGTHWRIPLYYPTMGTGGYCIPVSTKYVVGGAAVPEALTIARETIENDEIQRRLSAELLARKAGKRGRIGILGIAYKGDLKVAALSPSIALVKYLKEMGRTVEVNDPYYSAAEIRRITGARAFKFPDDLERFAALAIVPDHRLYRRTPRNIIAGKLKRARFVLDNSGTWSELGPLLGKKGIEYHRVGDAGWLL